MTSPAQVLLASLPLTTSADAACNPPIRPDAAVAHHARIAAAHGGILTAARTLQAAVAQPVEAPSEQMLTGPRGAEGGDPQKGLNTVPNCPQEEQDCLSDRTHPRRHYDGLGIRNVHPGRHARIGRPELTVPPQPGLRAGRNSAVDETPMADLNATLVPPVKQTKTTERAGAPPGPDRIAVHGSHSLDGPGTIFQQGVWQ
ncbi:MAG TPA: hypothetical protein PLL33_02250 [Paracoccus sp. (in: a-proteobacteria)]|nr:hypothetical protein [Paracoccus sp. (in: a-proteobacteria)]